MSLGRPDNNVHKVVGAEKTTLNLGWKRFDVPRGNSRNSLIFHPKRLIFSLGAYPSISEAPGIMERKFRKGFFCLID